MSDINQMNLGPRWYVVHTYSGYENTVKANIEKIVENRGLGHLIYDIKIPVEIIIEKDEKTGEEKQIENKLFPSYVMVKMSMTDESWHAIRNITGVTGFVGPGSRPTPLTEAEIEAFSIEVKTREHEFKLGDRVKMVSGLFEGYVGTIQEIGEDKKQMTVLVSTGRRDMPIIVDVDDIRPAE